MGESGSLHCSVMLHFCGMSGFHLEKFSREGKQEFVEVLGGEAMSDSMKCRGRSGGLPPEKFGNLGPLRLILT